MKTFHIRPYEQYVCDSCSLPFGIPALSFRLEPSHCPYCGETGFTHV